MTFIEEKEVSNNESCLHDLSLKHRSGVTIAAVKPIFNHDSQLVSFMYLHLWKNIVIYYWYSIYKFIILKSLLFCALIPGKCGLKFHLKNNI